MSDEAISRDAYVTIGNHTFLAVIDSPVTFSYYDMRPVSETPRNVTFSMSISRSTAKRMWFKLRSAYHPRARRLRQSKRS